MRTIIVRGKKFELSKSEAERVSVLQAITDDEIRQASFNTWINGAPSESALKRRLDVGLAMGLEHAA